MPSLVAPFGGAHVCAQSPLFVSPTAVLLGCSQRHMLWVHVVQAVVVPKEFLVVPPGVRRVRDLAAAASAPSGALSGSILSLSLASRISLCTSFAMR